MTFLTLGNPSQSGFFDFTNIIKNKFLFIGFQNELSKYLLEFTRNLITAIVNARFNDPNASELTDLIKSHINGSYNDLKVYKTKLNKMFGMPS